MTPSALKNSDLSLLNKTLLKLALPRLIMRTVVVAIVAIIWLVIANCLLNFGAQQDYAFLNQYSIQVADYLNSINKYIWWGIVLIGSVILYFIVAAWIDNNIKNAGGIIPKQEVMDYLIPKLSPSAKEVLIWVWGDQREPITIKNLYDTRYQIKANRVGRLEQVRHHRFLLGIHSTTPEPDAHTLAREKENVDKLLSDISLDLNEK